MMRGIATAVAFAAMIGSACAQWASTPAARDLHAKARKEGAVIVWGPQRGEVEWISKAFPEAFPGIAVQFVGDNDVVTRAIAEARGGRDQIDVMWNSVTASAPLVQRNLVADVDWSAIGLKDAQTGFGSKMLYANKALYAIAFDPRKHTEADFPKTWEGFLDPKFKGRMTASLFLLPRLTGGLALAWGEDAALQWARRLINESDLLLTRAPRETFIESGERMIALGEIETTYRRHELEGKTFGVVIPEPVVLVQFGPLVFAKAPNPNAARLLAAWLATPEGKAARRKHTGGRDYERGSDEAFAKELHAGQMKVVFDLPDNMERRDAAIRKATPIISGSAR